MTPFVTKKIAAGFMIQRNPHPNHAEWLSSLSPIEWNPSIFEGLAFKKRRHAEQLLAHMTKPISRKNFANRKFPL